MISINLPSLQSATKKNWSMDFVARNGVCLLRGKTKSTKPLPFFLNETSIWQIPYLKQAKNAYKILPYRHDLTPGNSLHHLWHFNVYFDGMSRR